MIETTPELYRQAKYLLNNVETPIPHLEYAKIVYINGFEEIVKYHSENYVPDMEEVLYLTTQQFREKFSVETLMNLDELEEGVKDSNTIINLCPNVNAGNVDAFKKPLRTAFKNIYTANEIDITSQKVISGMDLLLAVGIITQSERDNVLNTAGLHG